MTPEERQMLADLFERVRTAAQGPRDPQAEAFINDATRAQPYAPYVLAQTVLVQQQALENATQRIVQLEAQLRSGGGAQQETSFLGNLGRSLFGAGPSAPAQNRGGYDASAYQRAAQQQPGYAPQQGYAQPQGYAQQAGPWGAPGAPQSGGFLSGALRTATGVAGGMLLANSLEGLLGGHGGMFGGTGFGGGGFGAPGETINNYYETAPDPAGQHAEDVLQDQDQDQDDAQDSGGWDNGGGGDDSF